jgi:hypothetical protein
MSFSPGDVLLVPVVFSDGRGHKKRPMVIIYNSADADLLVAPVTSQAALMCLWSTGSYTQRHK